MGGGQPSLLAPKNERSWEFCSALPFLPSALGCQSLFRQRKGFLVASVPVAFANVAGVWEGAWGLVRGYDPRSSHLFPVTAKMRP